MSAESEFIAWKDRHTKGITYWENQIPGLASLYELHQQGKPLPQRLGIDDIKFNLGLGYLAVHTSHDWAGSHLSTGINYVLMGDALAQLDGPNDQFALMYRKLGTTMEALQPKRTLEEKLRNIDLAIAVVGQRASGKGTVLQYMEEVGVCTAASSRGLR